MPSERRGGRTMEYWGAVFDMAFYLDIKINSEKIQAPSGKLAYIPRYVSEIRIEDQRPQVIALIGKNFPLARSKEIKKAKERIRDKNRIYSHDPLPSWDFILGIYPHLVIKKPQAKAFLDFLYDKLEYRDGHQGEDATMRQDYQQLKREDELYQIFREKKKTPHTALYLPTPAQLAGIFDSAGYMGIKVDKRQVYKISAGISNAHIGLMQGLTSIYESSNFSPSGTSKDGLSLYRWELSGSSSKPLLTDLQNELLFRKQICHAILDFQTYQEQTLKEIRKAPKAIANDPIAVAARNAERKRLFMVWVAEKTKAHEASRIRKVA